MKNQKNWYKFKTTIILTSFITIIPMFIGIALWGKLPDTIATHFGADNVANGWSSKPFTVFGLPAILLLVQWVCAFVILNDPKKKNISDKIFGLILWIIPVISLIVCAQIYAIALGYQVDIGLFTNLIIGILFVAIGNYLPESNTPLCKLDLDIWRSRIHFQCIFAVRMDTGNYNYSSYTSNRLFVFLISKRNLKCKYGSWKGNSDREKVVERIHLYFNNVME